MKTVYYKIWNPEAFPFGVSVEEYYNDTDALMEDESKFGFQLFFTTDIEEYNGWLDEGSDCGVIEIENTENDGVEEVYCTTLLFPGGGSKKFTIEADEEHIMVKWGKGGTYTDDPHEIAREWSRALRGVIANIPEEFILDVTIASINAIHYEISAKNNGLNFDIEENFGEFTIKVV